MRAPSLPGVWVQARAGERISGIDVWMTRPATISGRVLDSAGQPIVGTAGNVALQRYLYDSTGKRQLGWIPGLVYPGGAGSALRMNDRGEFRFYNLAPGEYYLTTHGGQATLGAPFTYYYPGVLNEEKAEPIKIIGGEDVQIGTLRWPPKQQGVPVTLTLKGGAGASGGGYEIQFGDRISLGMRPTQPGELVMNSVAPGQYDLVVRTGYGRDLFYSPLLINVGSEPLTQEVTLKPGAHITGAISTESAGQLVPAVGVRCIMRSASGNGDCTRSQVVPGRFEIELQGLPADVYVASATASDHDIITEGLTIENDTHLEIVLASPGGMVSGAVRDNEGNTLPDAVVALVPDGARRNFGPHYRAVVSSFNGGFEIHGIAPGTYQLYAWTELEGAAYRNAEFMKEFEDRAKAIRVEKNQRLSLDLNAF